MAEQNGGQGTLRIALGEYDTGWLDAAESLGRASAVVAGAAAAGAGLVVLPGWTMEPEGWAEEEGGESERTLAGLARAHGVHLMAGLLTRDEEGFHNTAVVLGPGGERCAQYRKQKLFAHGGEDAVYRAGDRPAVLEIGGVRVAVFICYDLRFPELFRAVARQVDLMVVIANWPAVRRAHWDVLLQARAIENQCYVVGVNRVGQGGAAEYDGGSAAYGPWGERLVSVNANGTVPVVEVDAARVARVREEYPFLHSAPG
jgi:predicted amidohydrolase